MSEQIQPKNKGGAPFGNTNSRGGMKLKPQGQLSKSLLRCIRAFEQHKSTGKNPMEQIERGKAMDHINNQIVARAVKGERWAIEHIYDRLEGKSIARIDSKAQVNHQITSIPIQFVSPKGEYQASRKVIDVTPEKGKIAAN